MELAPIILFAYNRPSHLSKTLDALRANTLASKSKLYIFSDAAKSEKDEQKVKEVRKVINLIEGFAEINIFESKENKGLANSVISGVSEVIEKHGKAIILEDDLVSTSYFLAYMNAALAFYEKIEKISTISAYCPPIELPKNYNDEVFFFPRNSSWGWATWRDRWKKVDWEVSDFEYFIRSKKQIKAFNQLGEDCTNMLLDQRVGRNNSWSIRFTYSIFKNKALTVYPRKSFIQNIGTDGSGTNYKSQVSQYDVNLDNEFKVESFTDKISVNQEITKLSQKIYRKSLIRKLIFAIHRIRFKIKH